MNSTSPSVRSVIPASALLIVVGWGGLFFLMNTIAPTDWKPLWLFYFLAVLGVGGLALPVTAFLNLRFPGKPPATHVVIARQAVWLESSSPRWPGCASGEYLPRCWRCCWRWD